MRWQVGRRCQICWSRKRRQIEEAIRNGPIKFIVEDYGLKSSSIYRHRARHMERPEGQPPSILERLADHDEQLERINAFIKDLKDQMG